MSLAGRPNPPDATAATPRAADCRPAAATAAVHRPAACRGFAVAFATTLALALALAVAPTMARADDDEASLALDLAPAVFFLGDSADSGATDAVPGLRVSLRGTWGLSDRLAVDLTGGGWRAPQATFPASFSMSGQGLLLESQAGARVTAGLTARLGVRWIPTLSLFAGFQHRWFFAKEGRLRGARVEPPAAASATAANDLLLGAGLGLDFRLGASWVFGLSVHFVYAFSLDASAFAAVELPLHAARYAYPAMW